MKRGKTLRKGNGWLYAASALIPMCMLLGAMALLKIAPFGNDTLVIWDANGQYLSFMSYYRTILTGENDFLYTFSKNLGGDEISIAAYYLMSPFNLLFALADYERLPLVYSMVIVLKASLSGLTFFYAASRQYGEKPVYLAFSTAYALMAYNIVFCWDIMWLDGVMILPLLSCGLHRLWQGKSAWLYGFSIFYALFTCFYIGYMLCIAAVIFCIAEAVLCESGMRTRIRNVGRFAAASCAGGFGAAFVWLPAFLYLRTGRERFGGLTFTAQFPFLDFLSKLVAGSSDGSQLTLGMPNVFCGTFVLVLVLVFLLNRAIPLKKRAVAAVVIAILTASFYCRALDMAWHGFSVNYCFNHRYSFLFSFVLVMTAQHMLASWDGVSRGAQIGAGAAVLGVLCFVCFKGFDHVSSAGLCVSFGVLAVCCLLAWGRKAPKALLSGVFLAVSLFEMGANCYLTLDRIVGDGATLYLSEYQDYLWETAPAVEYVKNAESGFYRMEKTFHRNLNEPMFFAYRGLSHFSSTEQTFVLRFQQKMGLEKCNDYWAWYNTGSTAEVDTLLGVKYVLSKDDLTQSKGYSLLNTVNGVGIYQNPDALSVALLADTDINGVSMEEPDYFALHNAMWSGLTGQNVEILFQETGTVSLVNLSQTENPDGSRTYTKLDSVEPAAVRYEVVVSRADPVYFYISAPGIQNANIFVDGEDRGAYFTESSWGISYAGCFSPGDTLLIEIVPNGEQVTVGKPYVYYENKEMLEKAAAQINERQITLNNYGNTRFTGSFRAEEEQVLLFTIPYDEGWQLYVDGERMPLTRCFDTFLGAQIPAGEHSMELRFLPKGLGAGCVLTALALVGSAVAFGKAKWQRGKDKKRDEDYPSC